MTYTQVIYVKDHFTKVAYTVYIAGRMRGERFFNFPAFDAARDRIRARGWTPISPADMDRARGLHPEHLPDDFDWSRVPGNFNLRDTFAGDVEALCRCDAIALLPGWRESEGASIEYRIAVMLGLDIFNADTLEPMTETILDEATRITSGHRDRTYGHPSDHWSLTVKLINARFGTQLSAEDWGEIMIYDKLARFANQHHRDGLVDICGYARCIERVLGRRGTKEMVA